MLLPVSDSIGIPPVAYELARAVLLQRGILLTILKGFIRDLEQQTLCRVHSSRLLGSNGEEGGIKAGRFFLQEEPAVMIDLTMSSVETHSSNAKSRIGGYSLRLCDRDWGDAMPRLHIGLGGSFHVPYGLHEASAKNSRPKWLRQRSDIQFQSPRFPPSLPWQMQEWVDRALCVYK